MIRRDALAAGFSGALGVALLCGLLFFGWRLLEALVTVSTPFVAGGAIALLLDPLVGRVQKGVRLLKGKRIRAVALVFGLFLLGFVALVTVLVPTLVGQAEKLVAWFSPATYAVTATEATTSAASPAPSPSASPPAPRVLASGLTAPRYKAVGLQSGVMYRFEVRATTSDANAIEITPDPVIATPDPDGAVALTWVVPPGARSGLDRFRGQVDDWLKRHRKIGPLTLPPSIDELSGRYSSQLSAAFQKSAAGIVSTVVGSISSALSVVLVPIVTFTLLLDMTYLRRRTLFLLPAALRESVARIAEDVGDVFSSYFRGMTQVCLVYMGICTTCLLIASIWFPTMRGWALLIGIVAGLLYAVPYVGLAGTLLLATTVTLVSNAGVAALVVFLLIPILLNQIFDNVITPRFVGGGIGLHPLLSMLALLTGASLFGLWGMLLAVPAAGSLQVILFRLFPRLAEPTPLVLVPPRAEPLPSEERAAEEGKEIDSEDEPQLA